MKVVKRTTVAPCPDCDWEIDLGPRPEKGQKILCPNCEANLEVVNLDPPELSWDIGDFDDDWDEDEDW